MNVYGVNRVDVIFTLAPLRPKVAESNVMRAGNAYSVAFINDSGFWCQLSKECVTLQML